ncbi:MAG: phosphatase PAP2 family protein [Gemmatimonadota bacterium]|jgi:membrane-associated phospholipid phosphatase
MHARFSRILLLFLVFTFRGVAPAAAQERDAPLNLEWWHPVAAGAGVAALTLIDDPVRSFLQDHRSDGLDDIADITKRFKDQEVFVIAGGGAILLGAITDEPKVAVTGAHILTAYGLSSLMMIGTKWAFGRARPSATPPDAHDFDWFNGDDDSSFPSGSAAVVFSLATTVSDAVDRLPVSIVLYTGATLNAWARLNSNRHWLSDVTLGAIYGITAAKLVNGEWTVFGLRPPTIWTDGRSAGMQYSFAL